MVPFIFHTLRDKIHLSRTSVASLYRSRIFLFPELNYENWEKFEISVNNFECSTFDLLRERLCLKLLLMMNRVMGSCNELKLFVRGRRWKKINIRAPDTKFIGEDRLLKVGSIEVAIFTTLILTCVHISWHFRLLSPWKAWRPSTRWLSNLIRVNKYPLVIPSLACHVLFNNNFNWKGTKKLIVELGMGAMQNFNFSILTGYTLKVRRPSLTYFGNALSIKFHWLLMQKNVCGVCEHLFTT